MNIFDVLTDFRNLQKLISTKNNTMLVLDIKTSKHQSNILKYTQA